MTKFTTGKKGHEESYELTTESPMSHYGIPVLRVRSHDGFADGDYGPADYLVRAGSTAALLVHVAAEQWGQLDREVAKSFLQQWPEGPQLV